MAAYVRHSSGDKRFDITTWHTGDVDNKTTTNYVLINIMYFILGLPLGLIRCCGSTFPSAVYLESTIVTLGVSAMSDTSGRPTVISYIKEHTKV